MKHKKKGSNAERELLLLLYEQGFACARIAGSGSSSLPSPDIIAIKNNKGYAIECKTKSGNYLNIKEKQIEELKTWETLSGHKAFVAWRISRKGWFFIHVSKLNKTKKAYSVKKEFILEHGFEFKEFIEL